MKSLATFVFVATTALAGCGKKEQAPAATGSATEPAGSAAVDPMAGSADSAAGSAAGSADAVAVTEEDIDVPTPTDFEDEASEAITDKNLEAQVKAFEADLGQ